MLVKQRRFGARDCPETWVRNQPTLRNNPEDGRIRITTCSLRVVPKAENEKSLRKNRWAAPHQHPQDVVAFALLTIYFTAFKHFILTCVLQHFNIQFDMYILT